MINKNLLAVSLTGVFLILGETSPVLGETRELVRTPSRGVTASVKKLLLQIQTAEDQRKVSDPSLDQGTTHALSLIRARTARALGRIQNPDGISRLIQLSQDPISWVRKEAVFGLGQLGWDASFTGGQAAEVRKAVLAATNDHLSSVVRVAIEAMGKVGHDEVPNAVEKFLGHKKSAIRSEALRALYRYRLVAQLQGLPAPALLSDALLAKINALKADPSWEVRQSVAYYFSKVKDPRGVPALITLSTEPNDETRIFVLQGLGRLEDVSNEPIILSILKKSAEWRIAVAAVQALKKLKAQIPAELDRHASFHVRQSVAVALAAAESGDQTRLEVLIHDGSPSVRAEAWSALLARQANPELSLFLKGANDSSWIVREALAAASAKLKADQQEMALQKLSQDLDKRVRASAFEALGPIETSTALTLLQEGLSAPELAVRGSALSALSSRKEQQVPELAWQAYKNSSGENWNEIRETCIDILGDRVSDYTTSRLREALTDPAASVALLSRKWLIKRGITDLPPAPKPQLTFSPYAGLSVPSKPRILLETNRGQMELELFRSAAPIHVANIVGLIKKGFYDGLIWHRVVSNFVVQGGDPDSTGWGSAGYSIRAEVNPHRYVRGTLGMPRSQGFDTGGVQIFITHLPTPHLDGQYTVFGRVNKGLEVLDLLERGDLILRATLK